MLEIWEDKKMSKRAVGLLLWVLAFYITILSIAKLGEIGRGGQLGNLSVISVEGEGEVWATANIAQIYFSVSQTAKTAAEAQKKAALIWNQSLAYLKSAGIPEKDIKTENYSIYPKYEYVEERIVCVTFPCPQPPAKSVLKGYEVSQSVKVKIRKVDETGVILEGLGKLGISNLNGPNFTIEDKELLKDEARKKAIRNAKEKAVKLADDLGVRLGKIVSFSDAADFGYDRYLGAAENISLGAATNVIPGLPKGEEKIISHVTITYELR